MLPRVEIKHRSNPSKTIVLQISWIRRRDFHVLTSSTLTYTNDERFQVLHAEGSDDWTLQIKYVQDRDNGTYECQAALWVKPLRGNTPACLRLLRALFEMVQFTHIRLVNTDVRRESLEEYRDTVTLRQSKHSDTRGIYIRERRASCRRGVYHKSRMHNRKGVRRTNLLDEEEKDYDDDDEEENDYNYENEYEEDE
ncbi:hypothetical protein M0804_002708 [Polistes exclamans]|nr:hypothetical protein M0804_002708 [Polistes exclamans]